MAVLGVGCGAQICENVLFGRGKLERYSGCVIKQMCATDQGETPTFVNLLSKICFSKQSLIKSIILSSEICFFYVIKIYLFDANEA